MPDSPPITWELPGTPSESILKSKTIVLTDDEIKASPTTGIIELVPGNAGHLLLPKLFVAYFKWTADYTNITPGGSPKGFLLDWGDPGTWGGYSSSINATALIGAGRNTLILDDSFFGNVHSDVNNYGVLGMGLVVRVSNDDGDFTDGDPANKLTFVIFYTDADLN